MAGKIVKAAISEYNVSKTVINPNELSTGKLVKINAAKPPITVKPEAVIAWPTFVTATIIASSVDLPSCCSSLNRSRIKIVNSVPTPSTKELKAIVNGL